MSLLDPQSSESSRTKPRRSRRHMLWVGGGVALLALLAVTGLLLWAGSASCENLVRKRLIAKIEAATGGRVEIAAFHWHVFRLESDADGLVIHGREGTSEAPYAEIAHAHLGVSILGLISPRILLRDLEIERPAVHFIVYADGTTNQPQPRKAQSSSRVGVQTFFDLQAGHVAIEQGLLNYENRAVGVDEHNRTFRLDFVANDVSTLINYVPAQGKNEVSYRIEAGARDLNVTRSETTGQSVHQAQGFAQVTLDLMPNAAYLRSLRLTAHSPDLGDHTLIVSGSLTNFMRPFWQAKAQGILDMRLLAPTTGYSNSPEGLARLDLAGQGHDGQFRVDGTVHIDGGSYVDPNVNARGVGVDAHVHADPEQLLITSIVAKLRQGGQLTGTVALDHWLPVIPGSPVLESLAPVATTRHWRFGRKQPAITTPQSVKLSHPAPAPLLMNGKVSAQFKEVTIDTVLDIVGQRPFLRLGLGGQVNGPATATWNKGDTQTLTVGATLQISPSTLAGEQPTTGTLDGTYTQKDGAVDLRTLDLILPASHVKAHGHLGAYPLNSPSVLAIDVHSGDLGEFDTVLRDLGLHRAGRSGAAALPATLAGEADFTGTWSGSLVDPRLNGNLKATNVSVELPMNPQNTPGNSRLIHWDAVDATGTYAASRIAVDHSQLTHGQATLQLQGVLTAAPMPGPHARRPTFDSNSELHATVNASDVDTNELAPFFGGSLPFTGALSGQITADGPIHALDGAGSLTLEHGTLYGEPVAHLRAQGRIVGRAVQLSSIDLHDDAGHISGTGSYDLQSRRFQVSAQGAQIDISRIQKVRQNGADVHGFLEFALSGSGTLEDPRLQAQGRVSGLALGGEPFGDLQISAHSANQALEYDLSTRFQTASLSVHGQTRLDKDHTTQARLEFSQFNVEGLLKAVQVPGLTGQSALAGTVTLEGPLARPNEMRGEARLQELAADIAGVHLASQGPVHAVLANGRISLDPLHITGEDTDLRAQGGIDLNGNRRLDFAASGSINLKLAETLDSDLTASGVTTFQLEAHGPLNNPGLRGRVDFQNASLALEDLPNSLSQLHGTLEFNQNRLEVRSLTATTGGGQLSVSGYLAYQHGIFADLSVAGKGVRIRYPEGVSSLADANLQLQGPQNNLLLSGNVTVTRFSVSPDLDIAALAAQAGKVQPVVSPNAPSNHVRLDVRIQSSPQLNFQNAYAKLAGDVDLRLRGTLATPSLLGRVSVTEGSATIAGTRYELQRGDVTFTNPVRIEPAIDLNATARVEDYDITLGLHGSLSKMSVSYRSDPPLPEADVVALLALGRTASDQQIYGQQQVQATANPTTQALLGGALNATVSSRVQKLFGAGAVKVDPNYLGVLGNSTTRITVEEQISKYVTLTYATDVNTTAQQLLQAEIAINRHVSLLVARDESGVFSMVVKAVRRYR
ncbi:MAG TPA: translocation/assembly module TamB domain-containing protein [Terracidiphilus sp.]|nr:translocation/assembly module TamB domain-containing protein [Terracidiphilus sp.]